VTTRKIQKKKRKEKNNLIKKNIFSHSEIPFNQITKFSHKKRKKEKKKRKEKKIWFFFHCLFCCGQLSYQYHYLQNWLLIRLSIVEG